jgi:hypothetical protein
LLCCYAGNFMLLSVLAASGLTSRTAKLRALALTARLKQLSRSTPRGGLHPLQQPRHQLSASSSHLPASYAATAGAGAGIVPDQLQQGLAAAQQQQQQQQQQQLAASLPPEDRWVLDLPRSRGFAAAAEEGDGVAGQTGRPRAGQRLYTRSGRVRVAVSIVLLIILPNTFHPP